MATTIKASTRMLPLAVMLGALLAVCAPVAAQSVNTPNIVFMLSDDQRWDAIGFVQQQLGTEGRFPFLINDTPNIDQLAASGVWFKNAFVVDSLCSPSRAAFLTGKYNHANGIVNNYTSFPVNTRTFASVLRAAGYRTGYFGKWHMGSQRSRPGFDEYASFVGQGEYVNCPLIVNGVDTPTVGWVDDVTTGYSIDFIKRHAGRQPFLMVLGFKTAHGPYDNTASPERTKNLFTTANIDTPPNATDYPPYLVDPQPSTFGGVQFRNYFRAVAGMDASVGRVLKALDDEGIANDTVVIFASDNGWHMREHGSRSPVQRDGEKRSAYEASIRIPMIIRYPPLTKAGGRAIDATVLNIDLAPTLVDVAGVPISGMQGKSWVPLLNGSAESVRWGMLYEYFRESGFIVPRIRALRRDDGLKLIEYPDHPEYGREFYNLKKDPWETNNLIMDPSLAGQLNAMTTQMQQTAERLGYRIPPGAGIQN